MTAIPVSCYWGSYKQRADTTWSDTRLMEVIEDMVRTGARPHLVMCKIKREVSEMDLSKGIKCIDFEDFEGRPRKLTIISTDGLKYELKEKYRRRVN